MTKLRELRKREGLKLREVAVRIGSTPSTVHDAEVRGLRTVRIAAKYAQAFPGKTWRDLLDEPDLAPAPASAQQ